MQSKAFHAFTVKLDYFNDDLDLMDVLREAVVANDLTEDSSSLVLKNVVPEKHVYLARRQNSPGSRRNIINHLRATLYSSYIKDIYEEVTHYLKAILEQSARKGLRAEQVIGDHPFEVNARDILKQGSWDNVAQLITDSVFKKIEGQRSTLKLLTQISKKLGLNVDAGLIQDALPYLEIRHFLIHSDGQLPDNFTRKYPQIPVNNRGRISLSYSLVRDLHDKVYELMAEYDKAVIEKDLLGEEDVMP
jgi:hypothetical protein